MYGGAKKTGFSARNKSVSGIRCRGVKMHIQNSLTARLTSTFAVSLAVVAISGCGASKEEKEARFKEFWDKQHVEITAEIMKVIPEDEEGGEVSYKLFEGQDGLNLAILAYEVR